ncbi:MAG TPA: DUF402 domain-containing protein [Gemmatimonadales bacterium]
MNDAVRIHYHRPGKGTTVYHEHLVLDRADVKVTLLTEYDGEEVRVDHTTILPAGAPIVWYLFPSEWRDVGRFHLADGTLTGWYTNFRLPIRLEGRDWSCTDLFLDHWLPVTGVPAWLDEDEYDAARRDGTIDRMTAARMATERHEIDRLVDGGQWPPDICRTLDLITVRQVAGA